MVKMLKSMDLVKKWMQNAKGFDTVLKSLQFISAGEGKCVATMVVGEEHTNLMGGLHGGFSATVVDVVSALGLLTHKNVPSVSVNINMTYLKGATIGDELLIESRTLRSGKTMAYLEVEIKNKNTNELLVKGEHTKFILDSS